MGSPDIVVAGCVFAARDGFFVAESVDRVRAAILCVCELSAVAMRRMRCAAIVVTAMAISRAFVARVGLTLVRTKLVPGFCFAGTSVVPAFHSLTSSRSAIQKHWSGMSKSSATRPVA